MFTGASTLNLDAKGRMAIPARYRGVLAERCDSRVVVTVHPREHCLWLYPADKWENEVAPELAGLSSLVRGTAILKRLMLGYASEQEMDKQGRILLPAEVREYARLGKKVSLIGQGELFEIWNGDDMSHTLDQWIEEAESIDFGEVPGIADLGL